MSDVSAIAAKPAERAQLPHGGGGALREPRITVHIGVEDAGLAGLADLLKEVFPIYFDLATGKTGALDGEILTEGPGRTGSRPQYARVSSLWLPPAPESAAPGQLMDAEISFADDADVPFPFRGRNMSGKISAAPRRVLPASGEKVLAACDGDPVWTLRQDGGVPHFRSGFVLPRLGADEGLRDLLNEGRFFELLPLLHWLRGLSAEMAWSGPGLRACFIFDDPNLHWPSYGFVNYREIAARAARGNYHVSFATIPLDAWLVNPATARIFRENSRTLSLAVHGNNHVANELARDYSPAKRAALLGQAARRTERLDRKAGVPVCRVMVPPHGACSEAMLADLPGFGFESACISFGSLRYHNRDCGWTRSLGLLPSSWVQGCPVLPRWGFTGQTANAILLAAFLQQPIILRGHQEDLGSGIELLDNLAAQINALGNVKWSNLTGLNRVNYQWRKDGKTFRIRPFSRNFNLFVPAESSEIVIEGSGTGAMTGWRISPQAGRGFILTNGEPLPTAEVGSGMVSVEAAPASPIPLPRAGAGRLNLSSLARRLLTESRDRFLPSFKCG